MTDRSRTTDDDGSQDTPAEGFRRREFVALGAGVSATMLAGCAGDGSLSPSDSSDGSDNSNDSDGSDGSGSSQMLTGSFRLLISDAPADIADFDRLDVTLSTARVFVAQDEDGTEGEDEDDEDDEDEEETDGEADDDDDSDQAGNETETDTDPANGTAEGAETESEEDGDTDDEKNGDTDDEEDDDGSDRGFAVVDLDGATVDLTQVIDEDAMAVFDGEIAAGDYEKVELSVSTVEGIVGGEEVDVKLPSEKLQITNGFEVTPDEPVSFVFDINVVKRGQKNGYILKPVISGSGVAGRDVDVNEIDDDDEDDEQEADDDSEDSSGPESETDDGGADGNESADAQNGTATGSGD